MLRCLRRGLIYCVRGRIGGILFYFQDFARSDLITELAVHFRLYESDIAHHSY